MASKKLSFLALMLAILPISISLSYIPRQVTAQGTSPNFQTYTNTDLGFTIQYPSDWAVDDKNMTTLHIKVLHYISKEFTSNKTYSLGPRYQLALIE